MKKLITFFEQFKEKSITLEILEKDFGFDPKEVLSLLTDFNTLDKHKLDSKFKCKYEYYDEIGQLSNDRFAHMKKDYTKKLVNIINRQYVDTQLLYNFFIHYMGNHKICYGSIESDDSIGGLYYDAWIDENEQEIPDYYHTRSLDKLMTILSLHFNFSIKYEKNLYTINLTEKKQPIIVKTDISVTNGNINEATIEAIINYYEVYNIEQSFRLRKNKVSFYQLEP